MTLEGNNQVWIITDYGKQRITEVTQSQTEQITISIVKLGDGYVSPTEQGYYVPTGREVELKHIVGDPSGYPVSSKTLKKDSQGVENIVCFNSFIRESTDNTGFQVYEIGLYEEILIPGGTELKLFAIGVNEPINVPAVAKGYSVDIDLDICLKSTNLASVYDKIYLDPKNDFLLEGDLDELSSTVLFVEGNLAEQISSNSHILGLGRARQLNELIDNTRLVYSSASGLNILSNLVNFTTDPDNILGYWLFNQTPYFGSQASIKDHGTHGYNMNLNTSVTNVDLNYLGIAPSLNFTGQESYKVNANSNFHLMNSSKTADSPFVIFVALQPNALNEANTIIAQSNYFTGVHNFELVKTVNNNIKFTLFTNSSNYISWQTASNTITDSPFVLAIKYNGNKNDPQLNILIDKMDCSLNKTEVGGYTGLTNNLLDTTSYTLNVQGTPSNNIDSKVSLITIIKENLSDNYIRAINQSLLAYVGKNIYYGI